MKGKFIILYSIVIFHLFSYSVQISQIDNSLLLFRQKIKLYISVVDEKGNSIPNLDKSNFIVYESSDGINFKNVNKIYYFGKMVKGEQNINFLLLIDNSGSMYFNMVGNKTDDQTEMRITHAKTAAKAFIEQIESNDKVAIVSYNSYYIVHTYFTSDKELAISSLNEIKRPVGDEAWTEIYASLCKALGEFKKRNQRNVIVILSDGENMPYYLYTKKPHREYGEKIFEYAEPITLAQENAISIFAINFGAQGEKKDKNLNQIAIETGGRVFDAYKPDELVDVYRKIVNQVQNEYILIYKANMEPVNKKFVKVEINKDDKKTSVIRFYFSSPLFGLPNRFSWIYFIVFIFSFLLIFLLSKIKFKNKNKLPTIEVIESHYGKALTKALTLNKGVTVIGSSNEAGMTIIDSPVVNKEHAKIEYDNKTGKYTLIATGDTKVNNKSVKRKELEDGDVITIGGITIVFDGGMMKKKEKEK